MKNDQLRVARQSTYQQAKDIPFTKVTGLPSSEQKETSLEETQEFAMRFNSICHGWAGDYSLLAIIVGQTRYLSLREETYCPPLRSSAIDSGTLAGGLSEKQQEGKLVNDVKLLNYAI